MFTAHSTTYIYTAIIIYRYNIIIVYESLAEKKKRCGAEKPIDIPLYDGIQYSSNYCRADFHIPKRGI